MKILKTVQKIPGGLMVIPLFLGAIINLLFPEILDVGGMTTATSVSYTHLAGLRNCLTISILPSSLTAAMTEPPPCSTISRCDCPLMTVTVSLLKLIILPS